jgi:hypothetical protein
MAWARAASSTTNPTENYSARNSVVCGEKTANKRLKYERVMMTMLTAMMTMMIMTMIIIQYMWHL